jgi:hypothetical protein
MPCIWGKHDKSQVFLNVAVFDAGVVERISTSGPGDGFKMHVFRALADTGAQATCITAAAAEKVGLVPVGKVPILGVSGLQYHNNYLFKVGFAFGTIDEKNEVQGAKVHVFAKPIEGAELNFSSSKFDVLLGMDIISMGSLKIDGDGSFSFCF